MLFEAPNNTIADIQGPNSMASQGGLLQADGAAAIERDTSSKNDPQVNDIAMTS